MGTVKRLAEEVERGLCELYPGLRKTFAWLPLQGWRDRLRRKGHLRGDRGKGEATTTGALARERKERFPPRVSLFAAGVPTNLGIGQEAGHPQSWILAMDCTPKRAAARDYGARLRDGADFFRLQKPGV
jgi:hypothetical protein